VEDQALAFAINLGLAGFLAIYLVRFITEKLNSKLDRLIDTMESLDKHIQELIIYTKNRET